MFSGSVRTAGACVCLGMVAVVAGCQSTPEAEEAWLFFPSPPAEPRVQFLTWVTGAEQIEPGRTSFEEFILGEDTGLPRGVDKPYGLAARDGVVYVCDTKALCLCKLDFRNKQYSVLGTRGPGRLRKPINVVIDPAGYKFVADPVRKQIVVFSPQDRYVVAYNIPEPCHPVDVAVYGNELYVLDNDETCQIVALDRSTGEVLRAFGKAGAEPGQFRLPNSLCVGPEGYLYVSDTHNWRIQKLTRDGEAVWVRGTPGYTLGQFGRPRGIRVGPDGIVYVVDGATELVQMFNPDGEVLMRFGGPGNVPGALVLPSTLAVDETSVPYFAEYVHKDFKVEYLLFVASQYGPRLVNVYAFGAFPEGYVLSESEYTTLERMPLEEGFAPGERPVPIERIEPTGQEEQ